MSRHFLAEQPVPGEYCFSEAAFSGGEFIGRVHRLAKSGRTLCGIDPYAKGPASRGWHYDTEDDGGADVTCARCKSAEASINRAVAARNTRNGGE